MMVSNRHLLLSLVLVLACAGCMKNRKHDNNMQKEVDIPLTDESFCSTFDEDLGEFASTELDVRNVASSGDQDFVWAENMENADGFKTVYFGFNSATISKEQREALDHNIELAKACLEENTEYRPTIVIEGHACHSKGQAWYNENISQRRAKAVCNELVKAGIPQDCIKVVARGAQVPAVVQGEAVTGDTLAQAPNRRCEVRVVYA